MLTSTLAPPAPTVGPTTPDPSVAVHTRVWFGDPARPLAGWLSAPADGTARAAVVLCPPMGEEGRSAHRTYRRLAETLAEHGMLALRFDYDGTGDSAGAMTDPGRVRAWQDSVLAAREHLVSLGVPRVAAVGMRLGATLAASVSAELPLPGWSCLVLWDPCVSGRFFLRESEALHSFGADADPAGSGAEAGHVDDGLRHTPGFQYDAETARALRGLDLTKLAASRPLADRVLLLNRDDRPHNAAIDERLGREGDALTRGIAHDQTLLLDLKPSDGHVPLRTLHDIVAWLELGALRVPVPVTLPPTGPDAGVVLEAVPPRGGVSVRVRERAVTLGRVGLAGVVVEPIDGAAPGQPWVVLPNVAAEHHIGPGRRWVEFARSWAAQGHRVLRVDHSGIGDSPTRMGEHENQTFAPEWIEDMRELMATLRSDGSRVVFVALCSGAYTAFEAALLDGTDGANGANGVDAIFAINPRLTLWEVPVELGAPDVRRAGLVPPRVLYRLRERKAVAASALWRLWRQIAFWQAPYRVLSDVLRRGTRVELVVCHDDGKHFVEVAAWWPMLWWDRRRGRLRLEKDDLYDHSLLTRRAQERIFVRASEFLDREAPV